MRPNILYLNTHDAGRYIEPYGHAVPTPNLQRFAREAAVFRHAHAAAPTCTPSRVGLLTGAAPHSLGCLGLGHRGWGLGRPECHLAHLLTAAGYLTALAGTQHEHPDPAAIGYQRILQDEGPGVTEDRAADFLAAQGAGDRSKPFFLAVGWNDTHRSFPAPVPADDADYCRPPDPLPDCAAIRRDMAAYRRAAAEVDARFGRVLQALEDAGLKEDTLVLCTTDHGIPFPMMKCTCTDHGTGVFFMLRWPGRIRPAVHDALVSQIDWLPTLCDELAIAPPAWLQGRSLWPALDGKAEEVNDAVFAEITFHAAAEPVRSVRTRRWRYIRRYDPRLRPVGTNADVSPSKELLVAAGWSEERYSAEELYDCTIDPQQRANRAGDPACVEALHQMRGRLDEWMRATDDPLTGGVSALPQDDRLLDPDDFILRVGG